MFGGFLVAIDFHVQKCYNWPRTLTTENAQLTNNP